MRAIAIKCYTLAVVAMDRQYERERVVDLFHHDVCDAMKFTHYPQIFVIANLTLARAVFFAIF